MQRISAIFFDFGGVLFHFNPKERLKKMGSASGISEEILQGVLWDSGFSDACDLGKYSAQEMYNKACELLQWFPDYAKFKRLWTSAFELNEQVFSLASSVHRNIQTGILTNNPEILRETLREEYPQVEKQFDPIIFSATYKVTKPDIKLFKKSVSEISFPVEEILFIDDSEKHVTSAKSIGMQTVQFTTANALDSYLRNLGIIN